jgi:sterol desaturase/sphingolipid hydroxylase (fatty acid hydroxylase superfamily)
MRLWWAAAVLAASFLVFLAIEHLAGLRSPTTPLRRRLLVNFGLASFALITAAAVVNPTVQSLVPWVEQRGLGLLGLVKLPAAAHWIAAFLLLDLSFYWWHRLNHRLPLLWRFHNMHHIDPDLDVTTAPRFHPGEILFSVGFRAVQILAIGVSVTTYLVYEVTFQIATQFHHTNLRLPFWFERRLCLLIVTPRMHGIHHSQRRAEIDANFSTVFSFWDRLHKTLRLNVPTQALRIGVPGYATSDDNRVGRALAMPFRRQRSYWPDDPGTADRPTPTTLMQP